MPALSFVDYEGAREIAAEYGVTLLTPPALRKAEREGRWPSRTPAPGKSLWVRQHIVAHFERLAAEAEAKTTAARQRAAAGQQGAVAA